MGRGSPALLLKPSGLGGPDRLLACERRWTAYPTYGVSLRERGPRELVRPCCPPSGPGWGRLTLAGWRSVRPRARSAQVKGRSEGVRTQWALQGQRRSRGKSARDKMKEKQMKIVKVFKKNGDGWTSTRGVTEECSSLLCFGSDVAGTWGQLSVSGPRQVQTCVPGSGRTLAFCPRRRVPPETFSHVDHAVSSRCPSALGPLCQPPPGPFPPCLVFPVLGLCSAADPGAAPFGLLQVRGRLAWTRAPSCSLPCPWQREAPACPPRMDAHLSASPEVRVWRAVRPLPALGSCPASKAPGPSGHALAWGHGRLPCRKPQPASRPALRRLRVSREARCWLPAGLPEIAL